MTLEQIIETAEENFCMRLKRGLRDSAKKNMHNLKHSLASIYSRYSLIGFLGLGIATLSSGCRDISWEKTVGTVFSDEAFAVQQTEDGEYIVLGSTVSPEPGSVPTRNIPIPPLNTEAWIIKFDKKGNDLWKRTLGGKINYEAHAIHQTNDEGYIIAGSTWLRGVKKDALLLKLDKDGKPEWEKKFGGDKDDIISSVQQTRDGGYIAVGEKDVGEYNFNAWFIKLDKDGTVLWDKDFGGDKDNDKAFAVQQTEDGGYIAVGKTKMEQISGSWVFKFDTEGEEQWTKMFGIDNNGQASSIQQTRDGGYVVAGWLDVEKNFDAWVFRLDKDGNKMWERTFGRDKDDRAYAVQQTEDGGYILAGKMGINGREKYSHDALLLKLDSEGKPEWDKKFGGNNNSYSLNSSSNNNVNWNNKSVGDGYSEVRSVQQTRDGGYVVAGSTDSKGAGGTDAWILKLDNEGNLNNE